MKKKKGLILFSVIAITTILSFGIYKVLAEQQFNTIATIDNGIINDLNEEFTLTINADDLPGEGLASGQFYVDYNPDIFQVETTNGEISDSSIEFGQDRDNNFSHSIKQSDNIGRVTVLYYDNSANLNQPLENGELFKLKFKYIGNLLEQIDDEHEELITISGEGFSTIQRETTQNGENLDIVDLASKFNNVNVVIRNRELKINNVTSNDDKIYNGRVNNLSLNLTSIDFDENTEISFDIQRENYYGDLNFDGIIDSVDVNYLESYLAKSRFLSTIQYKAADVNGDNNLTQSDVIIIQQYISNTSASHYKTGELMSEASKNETNKFTVSSNNVGSPIDGISTININLDTLNTIEVGTYKVVANIGDVESNVYTFHVKEQPVTKVELDSNEYTVGINNTKQANATITPINAHVKNIKWSVEDENIATVDEFGVITGVSEGTTLLYAKSMDGTLIQTSATINVVNQIISIDSNALQYTPSKSYGASSTGKIYDKDGGTIKGNVAIANTTTDNLSYVLVRSDDNNQTNIIDKVNANVTLAQAGNIHELSITIPEETLEAGSYDFKIINGENIESNIIKIVINDYIPVTGVNLKHNGQSITGINILKGDQVEFVAEVLPENATNKDLIWGLSGNNKFIQTETSDTYHQTIKANDVGDGTLSIKSAENESISKSIKINVIDPTDTVGTSEVTSNIVGNNVIDERFGGVFTNIINFTDVEDNTTLEVSLYNGNNTLIETDKYDVESDLTVINNSAEISIEIGDNQLSSGTYTVKYKYILNDVYKTEKTGSYEIVIHEFIPIETIESTVEKITLIKGQTYTFSDYTVAPSNATYKVLKFEVDNENISLSTWSKAELTANATGTSILTIKTLDGSEKTKEILVEVIEHDIHSVHFEVDLNNKKVKRINDKLTYNNLLDKINKHNEITTKAFRNDVEINYEKDLIGTGTLLKTYLNNKLFNTYTMIVDGDIDGNGKVVANDILFVKSHILKKQTLEGIYFEAGDIDKNGSANATDILYMKRYILSKSDNVWGD
ncbi:MAG: Ig-like domain-containing protein [Bacilli bacterium]|nr:Ig-like domain-containing protein [Bacilli bacterium]